MSWVSQVNEVLDLGWKLLLIVAILVVGWIGFSYWASSRPQTQTVGNIQVVPIPVFPPIAQAKYEIILKNTGETLLSNNITQTGNISIVHGYYEMGDSNRKWLWHNVTLKLDKYLPASVVAR